MPIPGVHLPPPPIIVTSLYDTYLARRGELTEDRVRSVGIVGAVVDTAVLSLSLPEQVIQLLGLAEGRDGSKRLLPVKLTIRDRTCTLDPFRSPGDVVTIGHVPLTALGFMLDADGQLVDDPFPGVR